LSLTRRIVEAQGGEVGVETMVGKGSRFYVVLPCDTTSTEASDHALVLN
jgi:signal transduction histidine kinase